MPEGLYCLSYRILGKEYFEFLDAIFIKKTKLHINFYMFIVCNSVLDFAFLK